MGILDWDAAGVGHPGIDLGTLRLDAAITFGLPTAAEILEGWQQATGQAADAMAYWDLVAALTTPTDLATWLPAAHHHGPSTSTQQPSTAGATSSCAAPSTSLALIQDRWFSSRQHGARRFPSSGEYRRPGGG